MYMSVVKIINYETLLFTEMKTNKDAGSHLSNKQPM